MNTTLIKRKSHQNQPITSFKMSPIVTHSYYQNHKPLPPRILKFNWSEHRPVQAEAAGSSPLSPDGSKSNKNENTSIHLITIITIITTMTATYSCHVQL